MAPWEGDEYQARFDRLAAAGVEVHGEADFVRSYGPTSVLDAGCGTGRVGVELARHGIEVTGVDVDPSMLATARGRAPEVTWVEADLTELDLGRTFDVVVMAGNVPLFTPPGTEAALVAHVARPRRAGRGAGGRVQPRSGLPGRDLRRATRPPPGSRSRSATPPGTGPRGPSAATTPCRSTAEPSGRRHRRTGAMMRRDHRRT